MEEIIYPLTRSASTNRILKNAIIKSNSCQGSIVYYALGGCYNSLSEKLLTPH